MRRLILIIALLLAPTIALAIGDDAPPAWDITMMAGEDYRLLFALAYNGQPIDLTGNTYAGQFRSAPGAQVFANFSANAVSGGRISVRLSRAQTLALSGKSGVWDLVQRTSAGLVSYAMTGKCTVRPTSTRLP